MAKKSTEQTDTEKKDVSLKVKLSPAEHKDVRIAAAERGITIADFLRESVLFCAGQAVNAYYQREIATKKPSRSKSSD